MTNTGLSMQKKLSGLWVRRKVGRCLIMRLRHADANIAVQQSRVVFVKLTQVTAVNCQVYFFLGGVRIWLCLILI